MAYTPRVTTAKPSKFDVDLNKLATSDAVKDEKQPGCDQCFPDGWPLEATSVGCEHGMWIRETETS